MKNYTMEEVKRQRDLMESKINDRYQRINDGETDMDDCFISHKNQINLLKECELIEELIKNNGRFKYFEIELFYLDGTPTNAICVQTKYGDAYKIEKENGDTEWINASPSKRSTHEKKGYVLKKVTYFGPGSVKQILGGTGMYGVFNSTFEIVPSNYNKVLQKYEERKIIKIEDFQYKNEFKKQQNTLYKVGLYL